MEEKNMHESNQEVINPESSCCNADIDYVQIDVESGEYHYYFKIPKGSPIGHAYDAAFAVLNKISQLAQEAVDEMKIKDISSKEN